MDSMDGDRPGILGVDSVLALLGDVTQTGRQVSRQLLLVQVRSPSMMPVSDLDALGQLKLVQGRRAPVSDLDGKGFQPGKTRNPSPSH